MAQWLTKVTMTITVKGLLQPRGWMTILPVSPLKTKGQGPRSVAAPARSRPVKPQPALTPAPQDLGEPSPCQCPTHGRPFFIADTAVPMGVPNRAKLTLPRGLEVRESGIPGAGLGVFNCGEEAIVIGTSYGPYQGEVVPRKEGPKSGYSWLIGPDSARKHPVYIDSKREEFSNWMRYVNSARNEEEQNTIATQFKGKVVYRVFRTIVVGEEMLVFYGGEYGRKFQNTSGGEETPVFSCPECPSSFTAQLYLHKHIKRNHDNLYRTLLGTGDISPETLYTPRPRPASTSNTLLTPDPDQTQRGQQGRFPCGQCGRSFNTGQHLRQHLLVHTGEKPHHCDQCEKKFSQKSKLRVHQRIHRGEKPHHCDDCGKNFSQAGELRAHQRIHNGEKPYHCAQCGKNFTQLGNLLRHQRVHSGEKPYHCAQCGQNFARSDALKKHQESVHTGQ